MEQSSRSARTRCQPGSLCRPARGSFNPLKDVAFHALDHTYSIGYAVCGASAVYAALLAVVALGGRARAAMVTEESLAG